MQVLVVWILDIVHSTMICTANWQNLVKNFGNWDGLDYITWQVPSLSSYIAG